MTKTKFDEILSIFERNLQSVHELMAFDETLQLTCTSALKNIKRALKTTNPLFSVDNQLKLLENIRTNDSLKQYYTVMYNQCIVLLVSYFSSCIEHLFRVAVSKKIDNNEIEEFPDDEFKVSIKELSIHDLTSSDTIATLFISKKNLSFQDMKSIHRSFKEYVNIQIKKDKIVDDIIFGLACRHAIVHNGSISSKATISQIASAKERTIKKQLVENQAIVFVPEEVQSLMDSMKVYVSNLTNQLNNMLEPSSN